MIESLRKYTGLIIVLFVLVLIGFVFTDTRHMHTAGGGTPYLKISGRNYTDQEYRKLGTASNELAKALMQSGDFSIYPFILTLTGDAQSEQQAEENFFSNRILLRNAKEQFGIYPGADEIDSFIRKLRAFSGPDGQFDQEKYRNFIEKGMGRLGLTEGDLRELASDILVEGKLADIIGAGLSTSPEILAKTTALADQTISLNLARIDIDPIEEKINPSPEEIKLYWETIQDAFKTLEKRKFTYLIATPVLPPEPAEIPALPADASPDAKAQHTKAIAERTATLTEQRRKAQLATDAKVDDFLFKLESQKSLSFEQLAQQDGWDLKTTDLFTLAEPPADLRTPLRSSSSRGTAADELFRMILTADPFSKISPAIAIGENEWLIARLEQTEASRVQTLDEARDEARARLIAEKGTAALKAAAEKATEEIKTALTAGKTFPEAATAAGITAETISLPAVTSAFQPDTATAPPGLFAAARYTDPGSLSAPVIESDRAFLIHVTRREVVKQSDPQATLAANQKTAAERNKITAFSAWLAAKSDAADIQQLYRKQ